MLNIEIIHCRDDNYSYLIYDKETNIARRFKLIEKEIIKFSKMSKQEVHDWYWSMEDILIHNFNLFIDYGKNREQNYKNLFEELK